MSGLLDKATEYSDSVHQGDNVGSKVVNDPTAIISAYEMGKKSGETGNKVQDEPKPIKKAEPDKNPPEKKTDPSPSHPKLQHPVETILSIMMVNGLMLITG